MISAIGGLKWQCVVVVIVVVVVIRRTLAVQCISCQHTSLGTQNTEVRVRRAGGDIYPYEEVEREENVEDEIDLLRCTFCPFLARLHRFSAQCSLNSVY